MAIAPRKPKTPFGNRSKNSLPFDKKLRTAKTKTPFGPGVGAKPGEPKPRIGGGPYAPKKKPTTKI